MLKRSCVAVFVLAITAACTMWKNPGKGWSAATGGEQLERLFWKDVQESDFKRIDRHLASSFVGAGPDGPLDRVAFLRQLQNYQITSFTLADCSTRLNGADVMVACITRREGRSPGLAVASTLSVWQQLSKGWVMVAHSESPVVSGDK